METGPTLGLKSPIFRVRETDNWGVIRDCPLSACPCPENMPAGEVSSLSCQKMGSIAKTPVEDEELSKPPLHSCGLS